MSETSIFEDGFFKSLSDKYNTEDQLVGFLRNLDKKISPFNPWAHPLIVTCWVELNLNMFLSIRRNSSLWEQVPERFKNEIDLAISNQDEKIVISNPADVAKIVGPRLNHKQKEHFLLLSLDTRNTGYSNRRTGNPGESIMNYTASTKIATVNT